MKKIMTLWVAFVMGAGLMVGAPVQAQTTMELNDEEVAMIERKREWHKKKHEKMLMQMQESLGVTEAQATALYDSKKAYYAEKKANKEKMRSLKDQKRAAFEAEVLDQESINGIYEEIKMLKTSMVDIKKKYKMGVREILSGEQFKKYMSMDKSSKGKCCNKSGEGCCGSKGKKCSSSDKSEKKCNKSDGKKGSSGEMKGSGYHQH